jgi:putative transcriptional regulator
MNFAMTTSRYDSVLIDHAAGNLPEAAAYVVEAHLSLEPAGRRSFDLIEAAGGCLLEALKPAPMALPAWLEGAQPQPPAATGPAPGASIAGLLSSLDRGQWKRGLSGMLTKPVHGTSARLLKIEAGRSVPEHGHRGLELTLVLAGALEDETGRFGRGDLLVHDEDTEHTPGAVAGAGVCICLIAQTAPVRVKGPLGWAINPFLT